jgi:hypothetical protein
MADINQSSWSESDSSNTTTPPAGWPAGILPSQVEPIGRAMMGAIKRWYDHTNATLTSTGSSNAYVLTYSVAPTSIATGDKFAFIANFTNTGTATLNINSLGAISITRLAGATLQSGDLQSGAVVEVVYDGTEFQFINTNGAFYISNPDPTLESATFSGTTTLPGSGSISSSGALTLGSSITLNGTAATNTVAINVLGTTTGSNEISISNTSGATYLGIETSSGGQGILNNPAYASFLSGEAGIGFSGNDGGGLHGFLTTSGHWLLGYTTDQGGGQFLQVNGGALVNGAISVGSTTVIDASGNLQIAAFNSGTSASSSSFWRGDGTWATPSTSGFVEGPGSSTNNYVPQWSGTSGTSLAVGLPIATTSTANAIVETGSGGTINANFIPNTTVTAGSYTAANITVGADGRITSATSGSAAGVSSFNSRTGAVSLTTTDWTGAAPTTYGALGTYIGYGTITDSVPGNTVTGSSIGQTGTWRNMGPTAHTFGGICCPTIYYFLFLRIA